MLIKIDGTEIAEYPEEFSVTTLDIDNGESTARTADGTLNRDRITVKRQIQMKFGVLSWSNASSILTAMSGVFFEFYYPDPMAGIYVTKTFYIGNRTSPFAVEKDGELMWSGISFTITER